MSDKLRQLCRARFRIAHFWGDGDVYQRLRLGTRWYESFDLIWDAPTRILLVAYCWTSESLRLLRDEMRHLHTALPQLGVQKKLHLILFHTDTENASEQPWPSGVSFHPIALDPEKDLENPPPYVAMKLDSILSIPAKALARDETTAHGESRPNWRFFFKNDRDIVVQKIHELAVNKTDLPDDLEGLVDRLLTMAEAEAPNLADQVARFLDRLWEARTHEAEASAP